MLQLIISAVMSSELAPGFQVIVAGLLSEHLQEAWLTGISPGICEENHGKYRTLPLYMEVYRCYSWIRYQVINYWLNHWWFGT